MLARKIAFCSRAAVAAVAVGCAGCSVFVPLQRGPTEADFATIKPGMTRDEVVDKARDLIAPVLGAAQTTTLINKLLALETLRDVRELRPALQKS